MSRLGMCSKLHGIAGEDAWAAEAVGSAAVDCRLDDVDCFESWAASDVCQPDCLIMFGWRLYPCRPVLIQIVIQTLHAMLFCADGMPQVASSEAYGPADGPGDEQPDAGAQQRHPQPSLGAQMSQIQHVLAQDCLLGYAVCFYVQCRCCYLEA